MGRLVFAALLAAFLAGCESRPPEPANATCTLTILYYRPQEECYKVGSTEECQTTLQPVYSDTCTTPTP